jgi:hypothetical protein
MSMRWISRIAGAAIALALFATFSSLRVEAPRPVVVTTVSAMYAVAPGGTLVDVSNAD